ncbi:MAG TPA: hypothetical protein VMD09_07945 [Solirubrobacteraceae bacterium]|nr:hypothetical protein [Solirubrobacteraceae bacterium]
MSDSADTGSFETVPTDAGQPVAGSAAAPPAASAGQGNPVDEHPEILVGAAFVGGLLLASILKRLAP